MFFTRKVHGLRLFIVGAALLTSSACSSVRMETFLDGYHREDLSIQPAELRKLQFYTSRDILVRHTGADGERSIYLPALTPGVVVDAGSDWIELSFREGGANIPFVVDTASERRSYILATRLPDGSGYQVINTMKTPTFYVDGSEFAILQGQTARLLVNAKDLGKLTKNRIPTSGRKVSTK
jgi:hypothetical protein